MNTYPETALYYTLLLLLSFSLAFISDMQSQKYLKNFFITLSFCVIVLFCGLRFFVGNDYYGYYLGFLSLRNNDLSFLEQRWEPGIFLLAKLFTWTKIGYIGFFLTCSLLTYIFVYKTLIREHVLGWGVYFLVTLGLLIMTNDQVRQGLSLSVFLYSLRYIQECNFKKYFIWILIASMFHYSAILLVFVYFFKHLKLNSWIWIFLIVFSFVSYQFGIVYNLIFSLIAKIPFYGELYLARERFFDISEANSGLGIIFRTLLSLLIAIYYNKLNKNLYATIFLFGSVLLNFSIGFMPAERFSYYFVYTNIIAFPLLFEIKKAKLLTIGLVLTCLLFFELQSFYALEKHGAVPYQSILFKNLEIPDYQYLSQ